MGISYNTSVSRDGLVLLLDPYNRKSYTYAENLVKMSSNIGSQPTYIQSFVTGTSATIVTNAGVSPVGDFTASIFDQGTSSDNYIYSSSGVNLTTSTIYTYSIHFKQISSPTFQITIDESGFKRYQALYTYSTGELATTTSGSYDGYLISSNVTSVGNGWYRMSLTFRTSTTSVGAFTDMIARFSGPGRTYLWGRQLEYGSNVNPYTVTTSTIVTRSTLMSDISGNGTTATIVGTPTKTIDGLLLNENQSSTQYIRINSPEKFRFGKGSFTVSAWACPRTGGSPALFGVAALTTLSRYALGFRMSGGVGTFFAFAKDDAGTTIEFNSPAITTGTWYNAVMVVNRSSNVSLYVDGNLVGRTTSTFTATISPLGTVGSGLVVNGNGPNLNGVISNIMVHNRALSDQEIAFHYEAIRGRYNK